MCVRVPSHLNTSFRNIYILSFLMHFHPGSHTHSIWDTQGHLYKSICNLANPWQMSDFGPEIQTGEERPTKIIGAHLVTILVSYLTVPFLNYQRCTSEIRKNEDPSPSPFKLSSTPKENICVSWFLCCSLYPATACNFRAPARASPLV